MVTTTILLLAALSATSGFYRRDFGRSLLRRTSHQPRRHLIATLASFHPPPVGQKRSYSTEYDVPAFKLERGAKKGGVPTRLESWVSSSVASINSNADSNQSPSTTISPPRILATFLSLSIAAYITRGIFFATILSVTVWFLFVMPTISTTTITTKSAPTNRFLQWLSSFQQRIHRVIRQFRALEKASTITPPPSKRQTNPTSRTTNETHKISVANSLTDHHHLTHVTSSLSSNTISHSNSSHSSPSDPTIPIASTTLSFRRSSWFPFVHPDNKDLTNHHEEDDTQSSAMNQVMEIQAALDASSARFTHWYRRQTEDRKRLKYFQDICNEYDQMTILDKVMEEEMQAVDQSGERQADGQPIVDQTIVGQAQLATVSTNKHADEGEEGWSVSGGTQREFKDISHVVPIHRNDPENSGVDIGSSVGGSGDENIVVHSNVDGHDDGGDDHDWLLNGGIMSSTPPPPFLSDTPQPSTIIISTIPSSTPSHDPTPTSSDMLINDDSSTSSMVLAPSLQSYAWRQWGKTIDWGKVRGQGSDIYSRAQGNSPTLTITSSVGTIPSRNVIITPSSRVTVTPSSIIKNSTHLQSNSSLVQSNGTHLQSNSSLVQSNSTHLQSNSTLLQFNHNLSKPSHSISSPPQGVVTQALVPVRQSPLLSAAASSTFGTPSLAHMASQALQKHKIPYYSSYPRSQNHHQHSSNNNNILTKPSQQWKPSPPSPSSKLPQSHHHHKQLQAHPHVLKQPQELEEERLWISSVLERARKVIYPKY